MSERIVKGKRVPEMNHTQIRVKFDRQGGLHIPPAMAREVGFRPEEEVVLVFAPRRIVIEEPRRFTDAGELLKHLEAQGMIKLCHFEKFLSEEERPPVTLEQLDRILEGVTIPVEEYLREERAKVDDPFRA